MTYSVLLALSVAFAQAQDTGFVAPPVVGGTVVPAGEWNDVVLVDIGDSICTGTLIGPRTVLTAAHCNSGVRGVIVGTKDYYDQSQGTYYTASASVSHPNYRGFGYDIAVVRLNNAVTGVQPRAFSVDCASEYIRDGNSVHLVGFGSDRVDGGGYNSLLKEASTVITDADCSSDYGCDGSMNLGDEIVAGNNGVDSCFGDSGGPMYLQTPYGYSLVGVVSRAGESATQNAPCGGGGIYTRADSFMDWIQTESNDTLLRPVCNQPPVVTVESFGAVGNVGDSTTTFEIDDADSTSWSYGLPVPPQFGTIAIGADQTLTFTGDGVYVGRDNFTFTVTDDSGNTTEVEVPLVIVEGKTGCGCATGASPVGLWTLGLAGLLFVRRRQD